MPNQKGWTMTIANTVTNDDEDIDLDVAERLAEQTDHDSLLADLSKTFDEVDNDLAPVADKEAAQAPVEKTAAERARDELGRFTAAEKALQEAATKAAKADETPTQAETPTGEPVKPQPPTSWSPAAKAAFAELPQDHPLVQAVAKRESEVNAGFAELKNYKELKHYSELAKSKGDTLPGMLQRFVAAEDLLSKNPTQGIMWLMRSYGVHPAYIAQQAGLNMVPPGQVPQVPRQSPQARMSPQQLAYQQQQQHSDAAGAADAAPAASSDSSRDRVASATGRGDATCPSRARGGSLPHRSEVPVCTQFEGRHGPSPGSGESRRPSLRLRNGVLG
jgi:hypothetical protein